MRFKNTKGPLKVYAVAGTQTVLFSIDIALSKVDGKKLSTRDAIGISDVDSFTIKANEDAALLAIEIPMN